MIKNTDKFLERLLSFDAPEGGEGAGARVTSSVVRKAATRVPGIHNTLSPRQMGPRGVRDHENFNILLQGNSAATDIVQESYCEVQVNSVVMDADGA